MRVEYVQQQTFWLTLVTALCAAISLSSSAFSQTNVTVVSQINSAFSGGTAISSIQLAGTANWYVGSLQDSGNVTLTATSSGVASMQLALAETGSRVESQSAIGGAMSCQWVGNDNVSHQGDSMNCLKPFVWFLPAISMQQSTIPPGVSLTDLGTITANSGAYREIQASVTPPASLFNAVYVPPQQASGTTLAVNPSTFLPASLSFQLHPDNGAMTPIQIEIQYSEYRIVNGVEVPFLIQRYQNGSLQLEIHISSVQVN